MRNLCRSSLIGLLLASPALTLPSLEAPAAAPPQEESSEETEQLFEAVERQLDDLREQWRAGKLPAEEMKDHLWALRSHLRSVRAAGVDTGGTFGSRLYVLEARAALFPGDGPKLPQAGIERGGGVILGRVLDELTGDPLVGAEVVAYDEFGYQVEYDTTGNSGYYSLGGLPPGTYRVTASHYGYAGELWNDLHCQPYCDPTSGHPIGVTNGTPASGIDFDLAPSGTMTGVFAVDPTGDYLSGYLEFWSGSGAYLFDRYVGGNYTLDDLAPGTYYVSSSTYAAYVDELFDDLPCPEGAPTGCDPTTGSPVVITSGATTGGIDFRLEEIPTGRITGTLTNAQNGSPIPSYYVYVRAYDSSGNSVATDYSGQSQYELVLQESGNYFVVATSSYYSSEIWEEIPCEAPCNPLLGAAVPVTLNETTAGIDFTLDPPGRIEGWVQDDAGVPLHGVRVELTGQNYDDTTTDLDGHFEFDPLQAGSDYFVAAYSPYHRDELWQDLPCEPSCDTLSGNPISVTPGQTTGGINFSLTPSGTIRGTVTAEVTGTQLRDAQLTLHDSTGDPLQYGYTSEDGSFVFSDVGPGAHYLVTNRSQFASEVFDDLECPQGYCVPTDGTGIAVGPGQEFVADIQLGRLGRIFGRMTSSLTGLPLDDCWVRADSPGSSHGASTAPDGSFEFHSLEADSYIISAYDCQGLEGRLYDDVYCPQLICDYGAATPLAVDNNVLHEGIDLQLGPLVLFLDGFESGDTQGWSSASP